MNATTSKDPAASIPAEEVSALAVRSLCKAFAGPAVPRVVLNDLDLSVMPGESVAILGPSGSGKSTLLHCLGALEQPDGGTIRLGDVQVERLSRAEACRYRNRSVGFVFQEHHLLPPCTALENVLVPTLASDEPVPEDSARALLAQVGLADRANAYPAQLSGGERQRVAIARALIRQPRLLLCDEPTGSLDRATEEGIANLLLGLAKHDHLILLMATHNETLARRLSRRLRLANGQLVEADS